MIERILGQLSRLRKAGPSSWSACCPAHEDRSPSLSIKALDDGRILMHCHAGCSVDQVVGALGLQIDDLFPPRPDAPGSGAPRVRRPWTAGDLLRLAAYESTIVHVVALRLATGHAVSDRDWCRMVDAVGRLGDVAREANG